MRILVLGGDGYLGWPTAMHLAARGHEVMAVDNYLRRRIARETRSEALIGTPNLHDRAELFARLTGRPIEVRIGDLVEHAFVDEIVGEFRPDCIVHYAEQPSAPYSMIGRREAGLTLQNNVTSTFNVAWAVLQHVPDCHIVKLGTMGEYGTPNIDIEEGYIEIEHKGRRDTFLYPRTPGSLYHVSKVMDTDLLYFYARIYGLRVTDLMQGPVYGLRTPEADLDERLLPNFHYDDVFGTVINRFLVQAIAGVPLTVYGSGGQTRGYLNLRDTLQCVELAARTPAQPGELRVFNQITETFTIRQLADQVRRVGRAKGFDVRIEHVPNPRKEAEEHYYNPAYRGLQDLGLEPHYLTDAVMVEMIDRILPYRDAIRTDHILPRVRWNEAGEAVRPAGRGENAA